MTSEPPLLAPLRLGVAGLGRAFTLMLPTFLADRRVKLVAAFDPRPQARARFAADFDAPAFDSLEAFAAHGGMEAVYVASPHQFHAAQTAVLAAHGKHVLVEKPMALALADCDAMIASAEAAGVQLVVGHCHSFDTPYLKTRELIRDGRFGAVRMIQALNYTDFLYRPRRPEELRTEEGGGVVFSQAAHQVDIVRLLAGSPPTSVRAFTGAWDPARPTEGAYAALIGFDDGAFASLAYSAYGHFDSDEWCGGIAEMGHRKDAATHGAARRRLAGLVGLGSGADEGALKNAATYGGPDYRPPVAGGPVAPFHQHFGPVVVSCDRADLRPLPDAVMVHADDRVERIPLHPPAVPRGEVIDEFIAAVRHGVPPLHDGRWARGTLQVCLAMLVSARERREVALAGLQGA